MQKERDVEFTPAPDMDAVAGRDSMRASGTGGSGVDRVTAAAEETAHDVAERAKEIAGDARHRAADQVEARIDEQKHRAADSLGHVAESLRTASRQLGDQDGVSRFMVTAANQVDNLASFLDNREIADIVGEVEYFARRQPAIFIGGAFALGVMGARFLKSSRRNLVDHNVRDHWSTDELTRRVPDETRDGVGRPAAPGYVAPSRRGGESDVRSPDSL